MKINHNHPIARALREAVDGALTDQELDALKLPPDARRLGAEAAREVAAIGGGGPGRLLARRHAEDLIPALPADLRDSDYLNETMDPAALAASVRQW